MRGLEVPERVEEHSERLAAATFGTSPLAEVGFYRQLVTWAATDAAPLLADPTDASERTNFSNVFGVILRRQYADADLGALYMLHELTHLLVPVPHHLGHVTADTFAAAVVASEDLASDETEVYAHHRDPGLRARTFPDQVIWFDELTAAGPLPAAADLARLRRRVVADPYTWLRDKDLAAFYAPFAGTDSWARRLYATLHPYLAAMDPAPNRRSALPDDYEQMVVSAAPDQHRYEANVVHNVKVAFALCAAGSPPRTFTDARRAVADLDGATFPSITEDRSIR